MSKKHFQRGFTLIELVLTIVVAALIVGVSAQVLMSGIETYSFVSSRKEALENARISMDRIVNELTLIGSGDITAISDTSIDFNDPDGNSTDFKTVNSTNLYRGTDILGDQLALLDFDYYKSDWTQANIVADVRMINIELTIQSVGGYGSVPLMTDVFPRGFMYSNFR